MSNYNIRVDYDARDVERGLEKNATGFKELSDATNGFEKNTRTASRQAARDMKKVEGNVNNLSRTFTRLATTIGVAFGVREILNFGKETARVSGEYEQLNISISTFLGSQEKANKLLKEAQDFSVSTPFTPEEVNETTKSLLAFSFQQDEIIDTLKILGDVSAGTGKDFRELSVIYGQVRIAGRLMGQDLLQFTNAGVPLIGELAKNFGVAESEIKSMVSAGQVGFKDVEKAFQSMTGEGGLFFNLMEEQSTSFLGRISTLQGLFTELRREFGDQLLPVLKEGVEDMINFLQSFSKEDIQAFGQTVGNIIKLLRTYGPLVLKTTAILAAYRLSQIGMNKAVRNYVQERIVATGSEKSAAVVTKTMTRAQKLGIVATKAQAVATRALGVALKSLGIGLIIEGVTQLITHWDRLKDIMSGISTTQRDIIDASRSIQQEYAKEASEVQNLFDTLRNTTATRGEQAEAIEALNQKYPDILAKYDLEKGSLADIAQAQRDVTDSIFETVRARQIEEAAADSIERQVELQQDINRLRREGLNSSERFAASLSQGNEAYLNTRLGQLQEELDAERSALNQKVNDINSLEAIDLNSGEKRTEAEIESIEAKLQQNREYYAEISKLSNDQLANELQNQKDLLQSLQSDDLGGGLSGPVLVDKEEIQSAEARINQLEELLEDRNKAVVKANNEAKSDLEDYLKIIQKLQSEISDQRRSNDLAEIEGALEKLAKQKKFIDEDLQLRRDQVLAQATTSSQRQEINDLFNQLEIESDRQFQREKEDIKASIRKQEEKDFQEQRKALQGQQEEVLSLRMQEIDNIIRSGQISIAEQRRLEEERLQIQIESERRRSSELEEEFWRVQDKLKEARSAGNQEEAQELEGYLNEIIRLRRAAGLDVEALENQLSQTRLSNKKAAIDEEAQLELEEIERQLRFGELSLSQREELERRKLQLTRESLKAQLALLGVADTVERRNLEGLIKDVDAQLDALNRSVGAKLGSFNDLFAEGIQSAFKLGDEETEAIVAEFDKLKGIVSDFITSSYQAEIEAIDQVISAREDRIDTLEGQLDRELRAKEQGFANSYDTTREALEEERTMLAEEQKRRLELQRQQQRAQAFIESAQQAGALAVAVANIIKDSSKFGLAGVLAAGGAILSMFGIWKKYKAQAAASAGFEALYTGGRIKDYMKPGVTPKSDRPGRGSGHRIEGTNLVVGADEWLLNAITSKKQDRFIQGLNSGKYDNMDLYSLVEMARAGGSVADTSKIRELFKEKNTSRVMESISKDAFKSERSRKQEQNRQESIRHEKVMEKVMRTVLSEQTAQLDEIDARRPVMLTLPDGTVQEAYFTSSGKTVKKHSNNNM